MSERKMTQFESLTDSIASVIRSRILNGEYKIGEKIKETHVAEELRVSRTPIRKAFKELEEEGLIEYIPNKGCFAKGFTRRDIEDVYAVRKVLEELTVEWAVSRITDEEVAKMAYRTELINPKVQPAPQELQDKHYYRKHGANAYYGQGGTH